jgi:CRP-like cAMP-binding protein
MNKHIFHKILYSIEMRYYAEGEMILAEGDVTDRIFFVINGSLEVYSEYEGNEFIIEVLKPGSIINYRNVFTDDSMLVNIRAREGTYTQSLKEEKLRDIMI